MLKFKIYFSVFIALSFQPVFGLSPETAKGLYFEAARKGNIEILHAFHQAGIPLNQADKKGYTALILSAYSGHKDAVNYLLKAGANACQKDNQGRTALMGAIFKGEFSVAKTLISQECDIDTQANGGQTAAMFAALLDRDKILLELEKYGANLSIEDATGNSVLTIAKNQGSRKVLTHMNKVEVPSD